MPDTPSCPGCGGPVRARRYPYCYGCRLGKLRIRPRPGPRVWDGICRHCHKSRGYTNRRRLCWTCYHTPDVLALYPPARRPGEAEGIVTTRHLACEPTDARPGSAEKVAVLVARAAAGQVLYHEQDRR